jgi:quercetin dioxygenase-like cupin family protein
MAKTSYVLGGCWVVLGFLLSGFTSGGEPQDRPEPKRATIGTQDQTGVEGKEIVTGTVDLPVGAEVARHTHPGDEVGYVLKGHLILKVQGRPDRKLKAGDYFFIPRGVVHSLLSGSRSSGMEVSTWVVDKGVPLVQPAP